MSCVIVPEAGVVRYCAYLCSDFMMCSWVLMADGAALMIEEGGGNS